jgi:hypothetical protein
VGLSSYEVEFALTANFSIFSVVFDEDIQALLRLPALAPQVGSGSDGILKLAVRTVEGAAHSFELMRSSLRA